MKLLENIQRSEDLKSLARQASRSYEVKSTNLKNIGREEADGWSVIRKSKTSARMQREKAGFRLARDRVWTLLFRLSFGLLSTNEGCTLLLDQRAAESPSKVLDVVAIDEEVVVAVDILRPLESGKIDLQGMVSSILAIRDRLTRSVAAQFPSEQKRQTVLAIYVASSNLSEEDRDVAKRSNVVLIDDSDLAYYENLVLHLGAAAKYQFLADMLPGKTIAGLEIKVPAVKTKMGRNTCYTFPISPDYLLKIAYVSHRTKGKASDINTYQRMIARSRLNKIRQYISEHGVFPTNIVLNIDKRFINFQRSKQENGAADSDASGTIGWLHLRPAYKSAWVIDGQHRLFAYSGHPFAKSGHLSVLAFEGLPPSSQARLFVDINAKQKSVKPSLLQELFAELNWDADSFELRSQAIVSKAVQVLDKDKASPLFNRIQTADTSKDSIRCISLASLFKAIERSEFFSGKSRKGDGQEWGPLWADNNEATLNRTVSTLKFWLNTARSGAPDWWDLGSGEGGGFAMNDSVTACINVLRSVLTHLDKSGSKLRALSNNELNSLLSPYARSLAAYFGTFSTEDRKRYRELRGVQGQTARTRRCQAAIRSEIPEFNPPGLDDFIQREKTETNLQAKTIIDDIEVQLKEFVVEELRQEFRDSENAWWQDGVPKAVRLEVTGRKERDDSKRGSMEAYFDLIDYRAIALNNWELFKNALSIGGGNKEKQTKWMVDVNELRNQVAHASSGVVLSIEALTRLQGYQEILTRNINAAISVDASHEEADTDEGFEEA
ncbi:DGQHR domain-containing protein [Ralstonia sp. TCR112]|uniref:DGQHR domain-containing protein n=1 Tax=Ralstonia sp. TCR112 TaxID=2601730 RepID=UPI0021C412CE|nr:DGQHR domain-containing protein [Ralstonia sp. TCR112]